LCGEIAPLESAYLAEVSPLDFVHWWAEKYDLVWVPSSRFDFVNFGVGF
jgi:hypothetical protein